MQKDNELALRELIGLFVRISRSSCRGMQGFEGRIMDETRNTFLVETSSGERKRIPKASCIFTFFENGKESEIEGKLLVCRPEDRTKAIARKLRLK